MARSWKPKQYFTPVKKQEEKVDKRCSTCKHSTDSEDNVSVKGDIIFIICAYKETIPVQNPSVYPISRLLKLKNHDVCDKWEPR